MMEHFRPLLLQQGGGPRAGQAVAGVQSKVISERWEQREQECRRDGPESCRGRLRRAPW